MTGDLWSSLVETVRRDPARVAFVLLDANPLGIGAPVWPGENVSSSSQ